jgi:hypothetical protein
VAGHPESDGFLGQEHGHSLALLERGTSDQERHGHTLAILKSGRQVDYDPVVISHGSSLLLCRIFGGSLRSRGDPGLDRPPMKVLEFSLRGVGIPSFV